MRHYGTASPPNDLPASDLTPPGPAVAISGHCSCCTIILQGLAQRLLPSLTSLCPTRGFMSPCSEGLTSILHRADRSPNSWSSSLS